MVATIPFPPLETQTVTSSRPRPAPQRDFGERVQRTASPDVLRDALLIANATVSPTALFDEVEFNRLWKRLQQMKKWRQGWDGYDALAPAHEALRQAEDWAGDLFNRLTRQGIRFYAPLVTADADGTVVLEWRHRGKTLSLYFSTSGDVEYLKVWGRDINKNMEDGALNSPSRAMDLLTIWLMV